MAQTIGYLCEQLKKERMELAGATGRGRSPGGYQGARGRSTSANRAGGRPAGASASDYSNPKQDQ